MRNQQTEPKVTIGLVVSGDFSYLISALNSLYETTKTPFSVYVVINTSLGRNDPQIDRLLETYPDVALIINEAQQGLTTNQNQILARAKTDYIALMNDDIIFHDRALDILVEYLDQHPHVGLAGPQLFNPDGSFQASIYDDPSLFRMIYKISGFAILTSQKSHIRRILLQIGVVRVFNVASLRPPPTENKIVEVVKGTVMVVRQSAYEAVGGMDETTKIYGEEIDWNLRMRQAGWAIATVPGSKVTHFGMEQVSLRIRGNRLIEDRKSILRYFLKYRPRWQAGLIRGALIFFHTLWGIVWLPLSRERSFRHFKIVWMGLTWQLGN